MKKKSGLRLISLLLTLLMCLSLLPATALAQQIDKSMLDITQENIEVMTIHDDGSQGGTLALSFDQDSGIFSGKLANYTDIKKYNAADIVVTLKGLPEGTTAQLNTKTDTKIADFIDGSAQTSGGAVSKQGEYIFVISLQNGENAEEYTLKLEKTISAKWNKLVFAGIPALSDSITYYGEPEGTLFQLDDSGVRTGETGVSEDCFNYEVYVSSTTEAVKPAGSTPLNIFQGSFSYTPNCKASIYIDDELLFEAATGLAVALQWSKISDGVKLPKSRTEMRVEFKVKDEEVIKTKIYFVIVAMDVASLISALDELDLHTLVWPDDRNNVIRLHENFSNLSAEEKAEIPEALRDKLNSAYELMRDDRVPSNLEIVKPAAKLTYAVGQTFDATGAELLATYGDGTTRTITKGFSIEPEGALTNESEVSFIYNTVHTKQAIKLVQLSLGGEGSQANPYKITSAEDMQDINDFVAAGQSTEGMYFEMTADIALPDGWKPIGITKDGTNNIQKGENLYAFSGTIDGKNHTLTVPEEGLPLLGYVNGAEVRNLKIFGKKIAGYGLVNNLEGVGLAGTSIVIDNVTLKSGSSTLKSGLLGANITTNGFAGCSAGFVATVRNCTIEKDVVIGYNKDQSMIGSIAGRMQGTVENCVSNATVYGISYVGGIIGTRDNAMGAAQVTGCEFGGTVEASGNHAGGIIGGAYSNSSAPNGGRITVTDCSSSGKITGKDKVGGIMGADSFIFQSWGQNTFKKNKSTGPVEATEGEYVGGVIGYLGSLNKYDGFSANYYASTCGTEKGIGFIQYIDTSCETHETESGAFYFNSSVALPGVNGIIKKDHNRTDDPLGADAVMLTYSDNAKDPIATDLSISGEYKTSYLLGEKLDLSGMTLTVAFHTGETKAITPDDVTIQNYDAYKRGTQTVSLVYGAAFVQIEVTVLKPDTGEITVYVSVLGNTIHGPDSEDVHTLADGNLILWLQKKPLEVEVNATVLDVIEKAIEGEGITLENPSGNYIKSVTKDGVRLAEGDNGPNSGWMYTLNGMHSRLGVSEQFLEEGDEIILHYTDDYTKESAIGSDDDIVKLGKLNSLLAALPAVDKLKITDAAAVTESMDLYHSLSEEGKAAVSKENTDKLHAAIQKMAGLRNEALAAIEEASKKTEDYLAKLLKGNEVFGAEWPVIGLARADRIAGFDAEAYYQNIIHIVNENGSAKLSSSKSTENSRLILALTAIGKDVTNVAGYNLLEPLSNLRYLETQGINGLIWALIAFDSYGHEIPTTTEGTQATRTNIIAEILSAQLKDGGWSLSEASADTDITSMAMQALAPYYGSNAEVRQAVDRAINCLSSLQNQDGGYASWGTTNAESCSQVLVALASLGIDPVADARFIKNGNTVIDALLGYYVDGGGFKHVTSGKVNDMATEQGYYALVAYDRFLNSKTTLYNMIDVNILPTIKVTSINLSTTASVDVGATVKLTATVSPANATNKELTWTSSDTSVATVGTNGNVKGIKAGTVTITATAKDGSGKSDSCTITVNAVLVSNVTLPAIESVDVGASVKLTATVLPTNATNMELTWKSSDTSVAMVDANGNVTGVKAGTATITATAKDGSGQYDICAVTVRKAAEINESQTAADKVANLIGALPENPALSDKDAIEAARKAYDALTSAQKKLVENYSTLTKAEAALEKLKADQAAADEVTELIAALPANPALTDEAAILAARAAYDALTDAQKTLVNNYDTLTKAEAALETAKTATATVTAQLEGSGFVATLGTGDITAGIIDVILGDVTVSFPAEVLAALTAQGEITIQQTGVSAEQMVQIQEALAEDNAIVAPFTLECFDAAGNAIHELGGPVTVTVQLTDEMLAQITDAATAKLYYYNPETKQLEDMNAMFDLTNRTVTFTIDHFSTFVIVQAGSQAAMQPNEAEAGKANNAWWLWVVLAGAVVVVGAAVVLTVRRRAKTQR